MNVIVDSGKNLAMARLLGTDHFLLICQVRCHIREMCIPDCRRIIALTSKRININTVHICIGLKKMYQFDLVYYMTHANLIVF